MPTDGATRSGGESPNEEIGLRPDGHLVFAPHDLSDRSSTTSGGDADLGFALAPRPATAPLPSAAAAGTFVTAEPMVEAIPAVRPPTPSDTFVISQPPLVASRPATDSPAGAPAFAITAVPRSAVAAPLPVQAGNSAAEPLWLVREPSAGSASPHGWSPRQGGVVDRSTRAAILRLREEAVHVSWQAAWLATTSGDLKHHRRAR